MYKIKFIRNWGTYKIGDIKETESRYTARALVNIHKHAVLLEGSDPLLNEDDDAVFNRLMEMTKSPSTLVGPDGKPLR